MTSAADYMRSAIRMAALSHAGVLFVMTHDSIGLGEDGPTHQPVEHLASFRAMPNILMLRPGDGIETAGAYKACSFLSLRTFSGYRCRRLCNPCWSQRSSLIRYHKGGFLEEGKAVSLLCSVVRLNVKCSEVASPRGAVDLTCQSVLCLGLTLAALP